METDDATLLGWDTMDTATEELSTILMEARTHLEAARRENMDQRIKEVGTQNGPATERVIMA